MGGGYTELDSQGGGRSPLYYAGYPKIAGGRSEASGVSPDPCRNARRDGQYPPTKLRWAEPTLPTVAEAVGIRVGKTRVGGRRSRTMLGDERGLRCAGWRSPGATGSVLVPRIQGDAVRSRPQPQSTTAQRNEKSEKRDRQSPTRVIATFSVFFRFLLVMRIGPLSSFSSPAVSLLAFSALFSSRFSWHHDFGPYINPFLHTHIRLRTCPILSPVSADVILISFSIKRGERTGWAQRVGKAVGGGYLTVLGNRYR